MALGGTRLILVFERQIGRTKLDRGNFFGDILKARNIRQYTGDFKDQDICVIFYLSQRLSIVEVLISGICHY